MTTKAAVNDFVSQKKLAVIGVSRDSKKFGNMVYKELRHKGYRVFPINPNADTIEGDPCYPNLSALPESVDGAVVILPPPLTEQVVKDASQAGIKRIWLQQGAESPAAIEFCRQNGMQVVSGECIMMFAQPVESFHKFHRWFWGLIGKLPK